MEKIRYQKKLLLFLLFFSLITSSTSFKNYVEEPVNFLEKEFYYKGNKTFAYIICNASYFNETGTYTFRFVIRPDIEITYFNYTFFKYPLKNLSYDYFNSLYYDYNTSEIIISRAGKGGFPDVYLFDMAFEPENNFEYLIVRVPIVKTNITYYIDSVLFNPIPPKEPTNPLILKIIIILSCCFCCFLCACCFAICKFINNNINPHTISTEDSEQLYNPQESVGSQMYGNNMYGYGNQREVN